jgi:hypothetical protein
VTITGSGFTGLTAVQFGTVSASYTFVSDTTVTATAPAESAGTVDITVTTPGGTSATSSADRFTYVVAPTVTAVSPPSGPTAGGTPVLISGTGFTGATAVQFGSTAASYFTVLSSTSIAAVTPMESAGTVHVTVTNNGVTSAASATDQYTFVAAPTVTGIAPTSGPTAGGTTVTITGTGFTGDTAVLFDSDAASSFTVVSDTSITAVTPAHDAGTVDVTVTTPGGTSATSAADQYTFGASPSVRSRTVTVTNVNSPTPNGSYTVGATIVVTIQLSGTVFITGTPTLALNSGGTANYTSGSGSDTLRFTYFIAAGQNSGHLDYASSSALTGTITDSKGDPVDETLPAPGAAGSLGDNRNLVIDTVAPTVVAYQALFGSQSYNLIGSTRMHLPWLITGVRVVFSKPLASGDVNSLTGLPTSDFSGLGTNTLTWVFPAPLVIGSYGTMLQGSGADALKDAAGNRLSGGSGFAQTFQVLIGDVNDDGVVNGADLVAALLAQKDYDLFADINGDGKVDNTDLAIIHNHLGTSLP